MLHNFNYMQHYSLIKVIFLILLLSVNTTTTMSKTNNGISGPPTASATNTNTNTIEITLEKQQQQIRQCFNEWTEAWNKGDSDGYLNGYMESPKTRYVSGKKVVYGKENIRSMLEARGGPKGFLSLVELAVEVMSNCKDAMCFGKYQLEVDIENDNDDQKKEIHTGCFTVHVRKVIEGSDEIIENHTWKIVSDHSS